MASTQHNHIGMAVLKEVVRGMLPLPNIRMTLTGFLPLRQPPTLLLLHQRISGPQS
jgi:hypothetical protein